MKFSEKWLREWVNPAVTTEQLSAQLTMAGLEVDAIEPVAGAFDNVVVGEIVAAERHPDADKLQVCRVNAGSGELLQIVCGAANARPGIRVPAALVGATLPGGLTIKQAKLRGVGSAGMLCSAKELGLAETSEGLLELPPDAPVGSSLRAYLQLDDVSIELGLTPNRADCLSVAGIAREVAALYRCETQGPSLAPVAAAIADTFPVHLDAPADCPRYVGRVVRGINPHAVTPLWMKERLRRSGIRSLGPVVDVTNYVLLELGQPMHAFDLAKLNGAIHVRRAHAGEVLRLLNGSDVTLDAETLVIADEKSALALAGVMGGEASAVSDATSDIFFESAFFAPDAMAGKARRYGLHTDASHRYERGVSPALQRVAMERATDLLCAIAGGQPGPLVEAVSQEHLVAAPAIVLRSARIARVLGASVPDAEVADILTRLGMDVSSTADGWLVSVPAFRFDLTIEEDLIEEVARVHGYNTIPTTAPTAPLRMGGAPEAEMPLAVVRRLLVERGYQEAITYSFVEPRLQALLDPEEAPIALANPISADLSVMRTSLWPALVQALQNNLRRQQTRVRLFETGLRFRRRDGAIVQDKVLGGIAFGSRFPEQWGLPKAGVDFFDIKADMEALLRSAAGGVSFEAAVHPALHPGQSARIRVDGREIGWIGALHPRLERELDLPGRTLVFEVEAAVFNRCSVPNFRELSKFPAIRRDIAVVLDRAISAATVEQTIRKAAPETLQNLQLFDVYTGEGIDSGRKSIALGLTLQAHSRTLTDAEVDAAMESIVGALKADLGATLRE